MNTTDEKIKVMEAYENGETVQIEVNGRWWDLDKEPHWNWEDSNYRIKPESKHRPFESTDELITHWDKIRSNGNLVRSKESLSMPLIWIKNKSSKKIVSILGFDKDYNEVCTYTNSYYDPVSFITLESLFKHFTFIDGSPCGVEE